MRFFLSGVDVLADKNTKAVVTLGDSITDGYNSTVDANNRWPDQLAERLSDAPRNRKLAVVNEGISGNRVLNNVVGPNGLSRFDRDIVAQTGVTFVTVLLGINDIGFSAFLPAQAVSADQIINGYRQLIDRAHAKCVKIIGATLTPFEGAGYYTEEGEAKRQIVNDFIRNSGEFDAVIDFDLAIRDPEHTKQMLLEYDSGDHLHPSDAGYDAMANSIDLKIFDQPLRDCVAAN
jgi:lysophospholipase L1-like esterase